MPLTFPIGSSAFWRTLPILNIQWDLQDSRRNTQTVGGEILTAEGATRLWRGGVTLSDLSLDRARAIRAMLSALTASQGSFFAHDVRNNFPMMDPDGSILGAFLPTINTLNVNAQEMRVANLPAGYVLSPGDMIGFTYGTPAKYAVHRLVSGATASAGGITGEFQVEPYIRPGAAIGSAVRLNRASIKAVIDPVSVREGQSTQFVQSGMSFSFVQTLG